MANRYTSTIYDGDQSVRDFMLTMAGGLGIFWDQVRNEGGRARPQRIGELDLSFEKEVIARKEKERDEILTRRGMRRACFRRG